MKYNKKINDYPQKDASKDVNKGQMMDASDSPPKHFKSRDTM